MKITTEQRDRGRFYTPEHLVEVANRMIAEQFGDDWRKDFVVWDNSCGTKALTRGYYFNELYCSTIDQWELNASKEYNTEATSFQFDFLNDPLDKLPKGLIDAFEQNKPIIFFMNPPYATANNFGETSKEKIAKTMVNEAMLKDKIGASAQNLYAQFIYRIMMIKRKYNLTNCHICMFTPTLYLSGGSWEGFRKEFFKDFSYKNGCMFKASHFADVAGNWGIAFSLWNNGENNINDFNHLLIDNLNEGIEVVGKKNIYNADNNTKASEWVREGVKGLKTFDYPNLTSALSIKDVNTHGKAAENSLGYFYNNSNNVDKNDQNVGLFSSPFAAASGLSILAANFVRCTSLFAARRLVQKNWINWTDEYMKPDTEHEKWQEFENDSIIYSLFESKSNQSSLRNIEYKGKKWDIKNEFFWMSKDVMMALAEKFSNDYCYNDARVSDERYVYKLLQGIELSKEARDVLLKATQIVAKSFPYRQMFNRSHPEYQINNWDASYYQVKAVAKEYCPDTLQELKKAYDRLSCKMLPLVYELGFLKKE